MTCTHVAAILFKIECGCTAGYTTSAPTDRSCEWNNHARNRAEIALISDINFTVPKYCTSTQPARKQCKAANVFPATLDELKELKIIASRAIYSVHLRSSCDTETASEDELAENRSDHIFPNSNFENL